jgi:hypothetical protein
MMPSIPLTVFSQTRRNHYHYQHTTSSTTPHTTRYYYRRTPLPQQTLPILPPPPPFFLLQSQPTHTHTTLTRVPNKEFQNYKQNEILFKISQK